MYCRTWNFPDKKISRICHFGQFWHLFLAYFCIEEVLSCQFLSIRLGPLLTMFHPTPLGYPSRKIRENFMHANISCYAVFDLLCSVLHMYARNCAKYICTINVSVIKTVKQINVNISVFLSSVMFAWCTELQKRGAGVWLQTTAQIMLFLQFTEFNSQPLYTGYRFPVGFLQSTGQLLLQATDE